MPRKPMTRERRRALEALWNARVDPDGLPGGKRSAWRTFRRAELHAAVVSSLLLLDKLDEDAREWAEAFRTLRNLHLAAMRKGNR